MAAERQIMNEVAMPMRVRNRMSGEWDVVAEETMDKGER